MTSSAKWNTTSDFATPGAFQLSTQHRHKLSCQGAFLRLGFDLSVQAGIQQSGKDRFELRPRFESQALEIFTGCLHRDSTLPSHKSRESSHEAVASLTVPHRTSSCCNQYQGLIRHARQKSIDPRRPRIFVANQDFDCLSSP